MDSCSAGWVVRAVRHRFCMWIVTFASLDKEVMELSIRKVYKCPVAGSRSIKQVHDARAMCVVQ